MSEKIRVQKTVKKRKWKILKCTDSIISPELLSGAHIEIWGCEEISIDGCFGVEDYSSDYVRLKLKHGTLILCGSGFGITYFENRLITVRGKISSVEFCV